MTATATISCAAPDRLTRAMARHFGHKVRVEQSGRTTHVFVRGGRFELEPDADRLVVRACAEDEEQLGDVKRIAEEHLTRFARPDVIEVGWGDG